MAWSVAHGINKSADHYNASNYWNVQKATWFHRSWWEYNDWGWIYTNDQKIAQRVTELTFLACAGHSNGLRYMSSGGILPPTTGQGCRFTSDIYVVDAQGNHLGEVRNVGTCVVESISSHNCWSVNGPGTTSLTDAYGTSFGNPNTRPDIPSGDPRLRHSITITYTDAPAIPPGGTMFAVIRATEWFGNNSNSLLVMVGSGSGFQQVMEPVNDDYIWVCLQKPGDSQPKWYKERKAYLKTNSGWEEMEKI